MLGGGEDVDEDREQLVARCRRLLVEAKAKESAGHTVEAARLLKEAHRCAAEAARASNSDSEPILIPGTVGGLDIWEP